MDLRKIVWASLLGAISVVIDILFKLIIPIQVMGTPYYAIPIIVAAIFLGPKYSIPIAFLGDLVSTLLAGHTYLPLFSIASMLWGIIPGLLLRVKYKFSTILLVVFITHIFVSATNSLALYIHMHKSIEGLLVDLPIRLGMIIPNVLIISLLVEGVLEPIKLRKHRT